MDVIDAFVVTLGLDPSQYNREIKNFRDDQKRLREEQARGNRDQEDAQKRLTAGMRTMRNEVAGFLFMLAGANSVKDFAANILAGDAATGRLARNLGMATEQVSAWEGAIKRVGGSAADIGNSLRAMSTAFQNLQLTGSTGHDADFQGLGVTAKDLQNPQDALLKISEASQRMGRPEFNARLSRIGFDQNTINLLAKGRTEVTALLEEQRKLGVVTDKDAEAAQRFQERLAVIETTIKGKVRPALEQLVGVVGDWLMKGDNLNTVLAITGGLMAAIGVAALAAYWPIAVLAGAIALVATNLDTLKGAWDRFEAWHRGLGESTDSFFDPIRQAFGLKTGAQAREDGTDVLGNPTGGGGRPAAAPSGSGGRPAAAPSSGVGDRSAASVERFFRSKGYTAAQARGITAAVVAEGGLNNRTGGGYKGRAVGIGQLLGPRRAEFLRRYGNNFTFQQELEFMAEELGGNAQGGASVRRAGSASETLRAMITQFYRPAKGAETIGDMNRGNAWLGIRPGVTTARGGGGGPSTSTQTTSVGQIIVYTAATDAEGIAHDMRGALAKRGLVVQANTGLQP